MASHLKWKTFNETDHLKWLLLGNDGFCYEFFYQETSTRYVSQLYQIRFKVLNNIGLSSDKQIDKKITAYKFHLWQFLTSFKIHQSFDKFEQNTFARGLSLTRGINDADAADAYGIYEHDTICIDFPYSPVIWGYGWRSVFR